MKALIQIENLHYRPASQEQYSPDILRGIDLSIDEGSFVAIIGENGSGKTTLIKHINGLLLPTNGHVLVDGLDTRQPENRSKLQSLVGMVFQNPADQIVASTVEEDVAFGLENINLPTSEIRDRVAKQLLTVGLTAEATRPPHLLSGGQIQMVALAGVLARQPRVILFDEPTSMLDPQTRQSFLERLSQLRQDGMTIVYVTHHLEETLAADHIVVMHAGKIAFSGSPNEIYYGNYKLYEIGLDKPEVVTFADKFKSMGWHFATPILSAQHLFEALPRYSGPATKSKQQSMEDTSQEGPALIALNSVHYTYLFGSPLAHKALNGATLKISPNIIHAIAGANGSGKSTLLQHINGILRPEQGRVHVGDFKLEDLQTPLRDVVRKVGLVFQNPETQFFEVFVGDEIAYGPNQFSMQDIRSRVHQAMAMVGLDFDAFKDRRIETLSGGEKRKVALAATLVLDQEITMFDEPSAGMDPRARGELTQLFKKLQKTGKTIIIASHRMEELAAISDNLSVMQSGQVSLTGPCGKVMTNAAAIKKAGLAPPLAVMIANTLIEKNWPIKAEYAYTPAHLFSSIKDCLP